MSRHTTVIAYTALIFSIVGASSAGYAATGGTFKLGQSNTATTVTSLTNSSGTALSLKSKSGTAPLAVNSAMKVANLNADSLDGLSSSSFRRAGAAVIQVTAELSYAAQPFGEFDGPVGVANCPAGTKVVSGGFGLYTGWTVKGSGLDVAANRAWVRLTTSKPSDSAQSAGNVYAYCMK